MKSNMRVAGEIIGGVVLAALLLFVLVFVATESIKDNKIRQDECVSYYKQHQPTVDDTLFIRQCGYVGVRHFLEN
jgi:hypothetical protein